MSDTSTDIRNVVVLLCHNQVLGVILQDKKLSLSLTKSAKKKEETLFSQLRRKDRENACKTAKEQKNNTSSNNITSPIFDGSYVNIHLQNKAHNYYCIFV